jgi:hypothetical protein
VKTAQAIERIGCQPVTASGTYELVAEVAAAQNMSELTVVEKALKIPTSRAVFTGIFVSDT